MVLEEIIAVYLTLPLTSSRNCCTFDGDKNFITHSCNALGYCIKIQKKVNSKSNRR